jgi:thiamine-phosphate pyrophosphorylase
MVSRDGEREWVEAELTLALPSLMLVTDRMAAGGTDALIWIVQQAVEGGVDAVQLREKDMDPDSLLDLAERLKDAIGSRAKLIVNSALEVALEAGADGVHLPEGVRFERLTDEMLVGRSVHSAEAAQKAEREGADYIIAGPIYETNSHPSERPSGLELVAEAAALSVPVLGIGGITAQNAADVMNAGASGVAVISTIIGADDPLDATLELKGRLLAAWKQRDAVQP